jgi:transcription elongation factor Elf1
MIENLSGEFGMGRRRKQVVKIVRRTLPELYLCPQCGKNTVKASINKTKSKAAVICSSCGLRSSISATANMVPVDAYCEFVDQYYAQESQEEPAVA